MIPTQHANRKDEEQIRWYSDQCGGERPVKHDVAQAGEVRHDLQGNCVELNVSGLDLNENVTNGTGLKSINKYIITNN